MQEKSAKEKVNTSGESQKYRVAFLPGLLHSCDPLHGELFLPESSEMLTMSSERLISRSLEQALLN